MDRFYKHIIPVGEKYGIIKNNERWGTFEKLTDALYERDRLIEADWDYERVSELPETENIYEEIKLPRFVHEYSYITHTSCYYKVYKSRKYLAGFNSYEQAKSYAKQVKGRVVIVHDKYRVQKSINGKTKYFSSHDTLEEAMRERDRLIENNWRE